jgi:hypothetical protein
MSNALMPVDGFDDDDPTASPIRGTGLRFKDGGYFTFSEQIDVADKSYVVLDRRQGWQKLEQGCPPEYLMQQPGKPRPPRPHVDETDWPLNFNGQPEHPWKLTTYLHLLDADTGEFSTFWTNTTGGNIGIGELGDQIKLMREVRPNAIAVITLKSREMPTRYKTIQLRPHFQILGWRQRDGLAEEQKEPLKLTAEPPATTPEHVVAEPVDKLAAKVVDSTTKTTKTTKTAKTTKTTKAGVTRITPHTFAPIETPSTKEVLNDDLPF